MNQTLLPHALPFPHPEGGSSRGALLYLQRWHHLHGSCLEMKAEIWTQGSEPGGGQITFLIRTEVCSSQSHELTQTVSEVHSRSAYRTRPGPPHTTMPPPPWLMRLPSKPGRSQEITVDTENCSGEYKPVSRIFPAPFSFPDSWGVGFSLSSGSIVNALLPFMVIDCRG